ncbi:Neuropeptide-like protein 7 [Caenorhabditis elegans]|uniref:Isoform 2 of Neuropeptide-like protein 7 n=1 Tax=Caenorhabditis elegans TaxID=6239 RepID=Q19569-2|nr:Neuropeptide-like protein 7 [Caenorhabditis elegans]CCG28151.1 Neuropeptide-like protein 7 [Caenorhabditis elegans]|eukprot:NP_001257062.1 Neuropeptide-like protein 7 [Caenorhabditis elegans]
MYIKAALLIVVLFGVASQITSALYLKQADFDDPRMFTSSFGKRSAIESEPQAYPKSYRAIRIQRRSMDDLDDPRLMTMSFGKRMILPSLADLHRYTMYDKRGSDIDDPRFFSGAFGRK